MKTPADTMRRTALILCPFALALALAPVASADEPDPVTIDTQKPFGSDPGDFSATGAITDSGSFALVDRHASALPPGPDHVINHLTQTFVSENGTFTMRVQIKETAVDPDDPTVLSGSGRWVITNGTEAYEGIHGQGTVSGTADRKTGVIDRTYDGQAHQTPSGPAA